MIYNLTIGLFCLTVLAFVASLFGVPYGWTALITLFAATLASGGALIFSSLFNKKDGK